MHTNAGIHSILNADRLTKTIRIRQAVLSLDQVILRRQLAVHLGLLHLLIIHTDFRLFLCVWRGETGA